ncbi:tRNA (guanosine(46)-N7)-methyltransferase TrmB [Wenzhouxiangella marina]|uniref:tRNA (guanine-N(7)-)-methyltransferase n=1 Tax=Wenzhouxiangella marina TaxID=1579979 RepID=A0A0K0XSW8_9GAMM|nr:tRNA (guanosine(46)-N7)-methyltransferase TrmB [Wenzhouxiangella marina]AKS40755.1 tRNA (guanine-N(7)-)-methyltransferase [Wenzhouxiangella marina]MBB6087628.1 tRNA (guanine-N7-)-methyltransferase [Wenzhouxiangella marina]
MTDDQDQELDQVGWPRRVRSFVRRPGRLTPGQQRALDELLPKYGVAADVRDLRALFERDAPLVVEIGCGNGQAMAYMAANEPEFDFVGIEVHEPGVGRLLKAIDDRGLSNVRVAMRDAVEVLAEQVVPGSLEQVRIYFPDPWPKKRHHKRRLIQAPFLERLAEALRPGGLLHLATDWTPYAEWMLEALAEVDAFELLGDPGVPRPAWRPQTHFETRGQRRGHEIVDLLCRRR